VYSIYTTEYSRELYVSYNLFKKMVWHCIGLDYNAEQYICIATDVVASGGGILPGDSL
jgi:hypothetical protein